MSHSLILLALSLAQAAPVPPVAPAVAVKLALADLLTLPVTVHQQTRYLWIHRGNAAERQLAWQVISAWTHALSRERDIRPPLVVLENGAVGNPFVMKADWAQASLIRLDLTYYRWPKKTWEKLAEQDPYFHIFVNKYFAAGPGYAAGNYLVPAAAPWLAELAEDKASIAALINATQSQCPILRADNWLWQVAVQADRKVGYYGLLEIADQATYERTIGFDPKANVDSSFLDEVLAAVGKNDSGVAQQNRRIARREKIGGGYWATFDNRTTDKDERNPLRTLNGGLKFDATETFGHLANGMWAVGLFNDKRQRQDSAPDFVGYDRTTHSNDGRIHVGLSCFSCHSDGGLQDVRCWFRRLQQGRGLFPQAAVGNPPKAADQQRLNALKNYLPPLESYLAQDRAKYAAALNAACGLKPNEFAGKLRQYFAAYDRGVTLERAAEDMGVTPDYLRERLEKFLVATGQQDTELATFLLPAGQRGTVGVEDWHGTLNKAQLIIRGLVQWPEAK